MSNLIRELSSVEHILKLPEMYIGSMSPMEFEEFVFENDKIVKREVRYIPAFLKIINEAIDNSLDEAIKTNFEFGNKIKVSMTDDTIIVEDNGRGVPVKKSKETGEYMPIMAFCNVRAGSNFDKQGGDSFSIGTHGIGIKATNIFSKDFKVDTSDGKTRFSLVCKDNLSDYSYSVHKNSTQFTKVEFVPDLKKFGLTKIDNIYKNLIHQRLLFLSYSFPDIKFYFNNERVNIVSERKFMSMFSENFELFSTDKWFVGVFPNDEEDFSFFSYVNGLYLRRGGQHIDVFANEITSRLREALIRKYKTIKPADIRNKLSFVIFFREFPSMKFDSQTKETLTNSVPEIKKYLEYSSEDFDLMAKRLLRNKELIESIVEMFKLKEELKKRKALNRLSNTKKTVTSDSYFPPIGDKKYLMLTEGFSATSSMLKILGRKGIAYYSLRGKPLNTLEVHTSKLVENKEFQDIVDILGLDLLDKNTNMEFENVVFLADADNDGTHIRSLLLTFFYKFAPKMIKDGRVLFMNTPLVALFDSKNNPQEWFFSIEEYNEALLKNKSLAKLKGRYYKGLGSFNKEDFDKIVKKEGSFENLLVKFIKEEKSGDAIKDWMSDKGRDIRKENLLGRNFNLSTI